MYIVDAIAPVHEHLAIWRQQQLSVAFVPTMGNLHAGHLSLVAKANKLADKVVVSIFVNALQFNDKDDLARYPRTLEDDIALLLPAKCDLLFTPNDKVMYPQGMTLHTNITVPDMVDKLCGKTRPGHFDGVATVVAKLFNIIQPNIAVFGEKDYQQLLLIKRMTADLNLAIDIVSAPTIREKNGLAMSSRNQRLTHFQYQQAADLYQSLLTIKQKLNQGERDFVLLKKQALTTLTESGFIPEYVDIFREDSLDEATPTDTSLRILAAAGLGKVRLIDNIVCHLD